MSRVATLVWLLQTLIKLIIHFSSIGLHLCTLCPWGAFVNGFRMMVLLVAGIRSVPCPFKMWHQQALKGIFLGARFDGIWHCVGSHRPSPVISKYCEPLESEWWRYGHWLRTDNACSPAEVRSWVGMQSKSKGYLMSCSWKQIEGHVLGIPYLSRPDSI